MRRCEDEAAVGRFVRKQKQQFDSNEDSFRDFYMWAFDFFKEKPTAKSMGPETASVRRPVLCSVVVCHVCFCYWGCMCSDALRLCV